MGNGTVTSSPSGVYCGNTCSASYPSGTVATLTATPATDGSAFAGWTGACSGTGTCTVTLNQDRAVTATFSFGVPLPNYALVVSKTGTGSGTVTSSPSGIDCGNTCSASYPSGTVATLTATPVTDGSTFAGWTGACSGTGTCTVTVNQSLQVTATFTNQTNTGNNLALGKPARQSSNNFGTTGAEAVDGNTDGDSAHGSVSHTHPDNPAWWEVDLQTLSRVNEVRIYNRTDCCAERLSNFDVMLSTDGQNWQKVLVPGPAGSPTTVPFDGVSARYVHIQLRDITYLSLAEVEVMGTALVH
jgi:Fe-S cluster biogenesis protein NfuA